MSSQLITELDSNFSNSNIQVEYPHIRIVTNHTDALPLVLSLMGTGGVPVYFNVDGSTYEVARVSADPLNLNKLLRVYPFIFVKNAAEKYDITDTTELMEVC